MSTSTYSSVNTTCIYAYTVYGVIKSSNSEDDIDHILAGADYTVVDEVHVHV